MAKKPAKKSEKMLELSDRVFDARPDTLDFRDRIYEATLVEVPTRIPLEDYLAYGTPVLNQGVEGACTGFGLATVANYLLRRRKIDSDSVQVSPRMFYEMAKRYDEWPGEGYQGSSARGAMKAWHKHGVCSDALWPYRLELHDNALTFERVADAARRPLGAYLRVNHRNLVAMHSALAEAGILLASANVHAGWMQPDPAGLIPYEPGHKVVGGHAFAIVAYDEYSFWLQNSWSSQWGRGGFAQISYDDWLANGMDVWVARLGVPVVLRSTTATATASASKNRNAVSYAYSDLRPHIASVGNNGQLLSEGTYGTSESDLAEIFRQDIPRLTQGWQKKRLLLYAHGGLVNPYTFIQRVAEYRSVFLPSEVYPLAFFWHTDIWSTLTNILQDAFGQPAQRAP